MATPAELLDNMVPVSAFSRGKAAQAFSSASNSTPVIVLKNNACLLYTSPSPRD